MSANYDEYRTITNVHTIKIFTTHSYGYDVTFDKVCLKFLDRWEKFYRQKVSFPFNLCSSALSVLQQYWYNYNFT